MSVGERGGFTATAEEGYAAIEEFKATIADQVRADILGWLETHATWHRNDLRIPVPADSKNVVGAAVNGLIRSGLIVETGERRKSADPASHGRKSNVYTLWGVEAPNDGQASGVLRKPVRVEECSPRDRAVESSGLTEPVGESGSSAGAIPNAPVEPPRLFEVEGSTYYEREAA